VASAAAPCGRLVAGQAPKLHIETCTRIGRRLVPLPGRAQGRPFVACDARRPRGSVALDERAPCPHCEQISTRGSDAAVAAPICPQFGQTIRVSMSVTTAAAGAAARGQALRNSSGSLAMFAAMRHASSRVSSLAAARRPGSSSK